MSETLNAEAGKFIAALATASTPPVVVAGTTHLIVPPNYSHKDITPLIEKAQAAPNRKTGTVVLHSVASLLTYLQDQAAQASAYVYADLDQRTITAVLNDQKSVDHAGWRDARAAFAAVFTPEFEKWRAMDKKAMTQTEFAEFIEDNIGDLQGEEASNLLTVATTIQATTGIVFSSAKRLQDGQSQLTYNENIDAKAGANGEVKIPKTFNLGLRIFKNGDGYSLTARLKYRIHSGSVKFFFELERVERAIDDAFNGYVEQIRTATAADADGVIVPLGYTVLLGKAGS